MMPRVALPVPPPLVLTVMDMAVAEVLVEVIVAAVDSVKPALPLPAVLALIATAPLAAVILALSTTAPAPKS